MKFSEHVKNIPEAIKNTFEYEHNFSLLKNDTKRIFIVGSGSSYSQAIYLAELISKYLPFCAIYLNPYSFVRHSNFNKNDVLIHFTQEAKRNDNICPINFAKSKGGRVILFSAKVNSEIETLVDEYYWYAPEIEKVLVASMSYISGYAVALKYVNAHLENKIVYDVNEILERVRESLNRSFKNEDTFTSFLYTGFAHSVAVEGALKANECFLQDAESYELKHYSHGKHFVSWDNQRVFNVLYHERDQDLVDIYQNTIFEPHHTVNYMRSDMSPELAVFEWAAQMLTFTVQSMKSKKIELEDIPVHDRIRTPHEFKY